MTFSSPYFIFNPSFSTLPTNFTVSFQASDGVNIRTFSFGVRVINNPPLANRTLGNVTIPVGNTIYYNLTDYIVDPEGNALSYLLISYMPSYISLSGSIISIIPPYLTPQTSNIWI